jgi:rhodanese-related sulfurtransferase
MLTLLVLFACGTTPVESSGPTSPAPAPATPAVSARSVDTAALKSALDAGKVPVLFDVRTPEEYAQGHVPGAKNVPLQQLAGRLAEVEPYKGGEVWLICEAGSRSAKAAELLSSHGYSTVNVSDGTSGWRSAGYPTE